MNIVQTINDEYKLTQNKQELLFNKIKYLRYEHDLNMTILDMKKYNAKTISVKANFFSKFKNTISNNIKSNNTIKLNNQKKLIEKNLNDLANKTEEEIAKLEEEIAKLEEAFVKLEDAIEKLEDVITESLEKLENTLQTVIDRLEGELAKLEEVTLQEKVQSAIDKLEDWLDNMCGNSTDYPEIDLEEIPVTDLSEYINALNVGGDAYELYNLNYYDYLGEDGTYDIEGVRTYIDNHLNVIVGELSDDDVTVTFERDGTALTNGDAAQGGRYAVKFTVEHEDGTVETTRKVITFAPTLAPYIEAIAIGEITTNYNDYLNEDGTIGDLNEYKKALEAELLEIAKEAVANVSENDVDDNFTVELIRNGTVMNNTENASEGGRHSVYFNHSNLHCFII